MGHEGYRIRKLKAQRNVRIETEYAADERTFIVTGTQETVKATIGEIQQIIAATLRNDSEQEAHRPRFQTVCRNFAKGTCRFANRCHFVHAAGLLDTSLESESPRRERQDSRSRGRSPLSRSQERHRGNTSYQNKYPQSTSRDRGYRPQSPPNKGDKQDTRPATRHWDNRTIWNSQPKDMEPRSYHPSYQKSTTNW